ncbi:hypothetical protein [Prevotellamassilia timonensis]|uniref:hypothetical protein n=1 Tax=Prevotellamassilia timonensis TaxID=1852370 RepID=UPI00307952FF
MQNYKIQANEPTNACLLFVFWQNKKQLYPQGTRPLHIKKTRLQQYLPSIESGGKCFKKTQIYHKKHFFFCGAVSHKARPLQIENELRVGIKVDA